MALILDLTLQDAGATGTYADDSASNNDGALDHSNTQDWDTTGPGGSLTVAVGSAIAGDDSITLGTPVSFAANEAFTLEFFAKRSDTTQGIVATDSGAFTTLEFVNATHSLKVYNDSGVAVGTKATGATTTDWHHYALVGDTDGSLVLFVDGVSVGSVGTRTGALEVSNFHSAFVGSLSRIQEYDTTRTAGQIATDALVGGITGGPTYSLMITKPADAAYVLVYRSADGGSTWQVVAFLPDADFTANSLDWEDDEVGAGEMINYAYKAVSADSSWNLSNRSNRVGALSLGGSSGGFGSLHPIGWPCLHD
jgi:hypothetical protein